MRNEDASQAGLNESNAVNARDDADHLAAKDFGPATGNLITGAGTINGSAGTDLGGSDARIVAIEGSGGSDDSFSAGKLEVAGQYGTLTIDADGNYSYVRNAGTPAGVSDIFTYTLQGQAGASDTARLIINIGDVPMLATDGTRIVPGPDGTVVLPAGVELSDVRVVGRDLVVTLPDGSTMVIVDGAIFVPQLVLDGVEVPASNLAALLIGAEPTPAAGDLSPQQQSSGGNFALPPPPLDPGVPLGDLLPPTELDYTPPEYEEVYDAVDTDPVAGVAAIQLDDDDIPGRNGNPGGPNDDAGSPNATGGGFLPGSDGDGSLEWALLSSGAPGGFSYNLQPDGSIQVVQVQGGNNVVVLTISVNADNGSYTVTENNPVRHDPGDTENNAIFVVTYSVTDDDGDVALGTLTIDVDDDTPTVTVAAGSDANVILTTDDAQTIGASSDTAVTLADFSGVFGATVVSPGADGLGAGSSSSYSLNITGSSSGLFSHGSVINLFMLNGVVVGTTGGQPASLADANIVFTVSVSGTGVVTLTQLQQIDHPAGSDPSPTVAPFADHIVSMVDGLVTLTRSETVVDNDGDSITGSASVNIGANLRFTDDGPTLTEPARRGEGVDLDETSAVNIDGFPISATSGSAIIAPGSVNYGADGQGPLPVFGFSLSNGGSSIASGLATAVGDQPITLYLVDSNTIEGRYGPGDTSVAFTLQMNANGTVTLTQEVPLEHLEDGGPAFHNDILDLTVTDGEVSVSLVNATVTYQDFDGDTVSDSVAIGEGIRFFDDGPDATLNEEFTTPVLIVDESPLAEDGDNSDTASFADAFSGNVDYGADGPGSVSYQLLLSGEGAQSGLFALDPTDTDPAGGLGKGAEILLYTNGTTIEGRVGATVYFTISTDASGNVTLDRNPAVNMWHDDQSNHDDPEILTAALSTIRLQQTVTDADGDTATNQVDLSTGVFRFEDDGPSSSLNTGFVKPVLIVDESPLAEDGDNSDTEAFAGAFGAVVDYGTDGPGSVSYQLLLSGEGAQSGLFALDPTDTDPAGGLGKGAEILLYTNGTTIEGRVGATVYFTISTDASGNVTLDRNPAVNMWHDDQSNHDDPEILTAALSTIRLQQTVTDADGDTATNQVDLSTGVFRFEDDGPSSSLNTGFVKPVLIVDESPLAEDGDNSDTEAFAGAFGAVVDYGTDGPGSVSYQLLLSGEGAQSGLFALDPTDTDPAGGLGKGAEILLYTNGTTIEGRVGATVYFTISTDASGNVTLDRNPAVNMWHDDQSNHDDPEILTAALSTIRLQQTVTDADGDTATNQVDLSTGVFRFEDDGPSSSLNTGFVKPVLIVDESPLAEDGDNSDTEAFAGAFGAVVDYGTDGPGSVSYQLLLSGEGAQSGLFALDPTDTDPAGGLGKGAEILLYTNGTTIEGRVGATVYFTISTDASGNVTLDRNPAVNMWHDDQSNHDDPEILTAALSTIRLQQTVTDADGDTATNQVDLSTGVFRFEDDGPSSSLNTGFVKPVLIVDESPLAEDGDNSDTEAFAGAFGAVVDYGTDGPGSVSYQLLLSGEGAQSGLFALDPTDTDPAGGLGKGAEILLYTNGTTIEGRVGATVYFTISTDASGNVTLDRNPAVNMWHDDQSNHDDPEILTAALSTIRLQQTVTDADGDTATNQVDLSTGVFRFEDDGPSSSLNTGFVKPVLIVDESPLAEDGDNSDTEAFAGAFGAVVDYGTDGPGSVSYQLLLSGEGAQSGLFALDPTDTDPAGGLGKGAEILLYTNGTTIEGRVGATVYFTISTDASGNVTLDRNPAVNMWHDDQSNHDDPEILTAALSTIRLQQTVTDADGDTATNQVDLSTGVFRFEDDGPSSSLNTGFVKPVLIVDESPLAEDGDNSDTEAFAGAFGAVVDYGTDGPGSVSYQLLLSGEGAQSGLFALDPTDTDPAGGLGKGAEILLYTNGTTIEGRVGATVYFTISTDASGNVTLDRNPAVNMWHDDQSNHDDPEILTAALSTIRLQQTVTDADGDTATNQVDLSTGVFRFEDDGPSSSLNTGFVKPVLIVDESPLAEDGDNSDTEAFAGAFGAVVDYGTDGPGSVSYQLLLSGEGAQSGLFALDPTDTDPAGGLGKGAEILLYTNGTTIEGRVGATVYFTISTDASGNVTLDRNPAVNMWHDDQSNHDDPEILTAALSTIRLQQTVTDADGDTATNQVDLSTGVFRFEDDGPSVGVNAAIVPNLEVDESNFAINAGPTDFSGFFNVDFGTDGPLDPGGLDFELNIGLGSTGLVDTLTNEAIILVKVGDTIEGRTVTTNQLSFVISVNADGEVSLDQQRSIVHPNPASPNESISFAAASLITLSVTATDADGDTATVGTPISIADHFLFYDDGPSAVVADDLTMTNAAGSGTGYLDADDDVDNNMGADGGKVIFTAATIAALEAQDLSSGLSTLEYSISPDGTVLTATKASDDSVVFTISLQPVGFADQYVVNMVQPLDAFETVIFNADDFQFKGGNDAWAGFVPLGEPIAGTDNNSEDLLMTPGVGEANLSTVNTSDIAGGIGSGNSVGEVAGIPETFRIDFVVDLRGDSAGPGGYGVPGNRDHAFDSHYNVNGASATMSASAGSTVRITAYQDADGNTVVGDGVIDPITQIVIVYDDVSSGVITVTSTTTEYVVNGNSYFVTLNVDGSVNIEGIVGTSGAGAIGTRVAIFTDTLGLDDLTPGYNSLEFTWVAGDTFKIGEFGKSTLSEDPVEFTVPIFVQDGDLDTVPAGDIEITLNPPAPPVVLDLDGDGVEFLGLNAGMQYDYGAGLVATAWVGADDGILVRDANGDGTVTDASEFVFGGNGVTDMEALHAQYGEQLDASDADFTMFAVWNDANSNGVVDANELLSLAEAGITSIGLVSDGASYSAANGDVSVAGSSTYTMADGSTGTAADAAFATGAAKTQEVERIAANSNTTVLAAAVAAAGMAASAAASGTADMADAALSNAVVSVEPISLAADLASTTSVAALAASFTDAAATITLPVDGANWMAADWDGATGDIGHSADFDAAFSALAQGTDVIASQMTLPTMATAVAMPAVEAISALEYSPVATIDTVEQILVDALAGGGVNQIDALMNALPDAGSGGIPTIDSAASGFLNPVPGWDMGGDAGFTPAVPTIITAEAMMLHVDAIQPAANG